MAVSAGTSSVEFAAAGFKFTSSGGTAHHPDLVSAFERYTALTFPHSTRSADASSSSSSSSSSSALLTSCDVTVRNSTQVLQLDTDESYQLNISSATGCAIGAETYVGALRGLESLSQLVQFDFDTQRYWVKAAAPLAIADAPRFPHRQILIDTARHFEPIAILRKMVDAISYAKVNTIHWHMTDAESFPFDSKRRPLLSRKGAFSAQERYSPLDVAGLVEYSRTRGVRLMVEFDAPGHAAPSWCKGYPDVCPPAPGCWHLLDYSSNETYSLLDDLLSDVADVFPESIVHLGGDECGGVDACAARIPSIGAWLRENGPKNGTDGYLYFVKRCGNRPFRSHLYVKTITLPRQARDTHRKR
jgi:hexosaminidase